MVDRLKQIPAKLLEFWNKYTSKQKTIIICVAAGVVLLIAAVAFVLTRTQMEELITSATAAESSKVVKTLEEVDITYKLSKDSKTVFVDSKDYANALMSLGEKNIPSIGMTVDELFDNGFSATDYEKKLKASIYKQDWLRSKLVTMENIDNAIVSITEPDNTYTIFSENEETAVAAVLTVNEGFKPSMAVTIANILAGAVGNKTTDNIRISDQNSNLLFNGAEEDLGSGNIGSVMEYKEEVTRYKQQDIYGILLQDPRFQDANIALNLVFDMDKVNDSYKEYSVPEGRDEGPLGNEYNYKQEGGTATGGTPGTQSNSETDYMTPDAGGDVSTLDILNNTHMVNERITNLDKAVGEIKYDESSASVNLISYKTFKEADLKLSGQLDNTTFDEYILANQDPVALTVEDTIYTTVSKATGIAVANLQINAWQVPIFQAQEKGGFTLSNYLMIILTVLIIALLVFVVFRVSAPVEVAELEPELSVEQLLATTKENQSLDDIEFSEKSETRKLIEKFVDENPDAVAQLLRNWLNEDWG